jgi:hypothetical protein
MVNDTNGGAGTQKTSLWSIERVVTLLTPTVFAPAALWISGVVARHFPGLARYMTPAQLTAIEVTAFAGAVLIAFMWLHGRQKADYLLGRDQLPGDKPGAYIGQGSASGNVAEIAGAVVERVLTQLGSPDRAASESGAELTNGAERAVPANLVAALGGGQTQGPAPLALEATGADSLPPTSPEPPAAERDWPIPEDPAPDGAAVSAPAAEAPAPEASWPIPNDPAP